jgi:hypothetical protein
MPASELLEVVAIFGLIVAVWFALLGWKLLTPTRDRFGPRGW